MNYDLSPRRKKRAKEVDYLIDPGTVLIHICYLKLTVMKPKFVLFALVAMLTLSSFAPAVHNASLPSHTVNQKSSDVIFGFIEVTSPPFYFANGCVAWITTTLYFGYETSTHMFWSYHVDRPRFHLECPEVEVVEYMTRISVAGDGEGVNDITLVEGGADPRTAEMFRNSEWKRTFLGRINMQLQNAVN